MKTYTKTIESPRLEITHDDVCESPRQNTNLGYFVTCDSRYFSPDKNETIQAIIKDASDNAHNVEEHMTAIKKEIKNQIGEKVIYIAPVSKYEHGGVSYSIGTSRGFDYSNNGFYIVTDRTLKEVGAKRKDIEKIIKAEIDLYNAYVNGNVYHFIAYNLDGSIFDSCGGFYNLEDIRPFLPKNMKGEKLEEYLK
jgi:hypothetical protein